MPTMMTLLTFASWSHLGVWSGKYIEKRVFANGCVVDGGGRDLMMVLSGDTVAPSAGYGMSVLFCCRRCHRQARTHTFGCLLGRIDWQIQDLSSLENLCGDADNMIPGCNGACEAFL